MLRAAAIIGGLLGVLAPFAGAQAADPPKSWPRVYEEDVPPPAPYRELASGWYLRADFAYRWYAGDSSFGAVTRQSYSDAFNGTVGFGLKYRWFRADLTYDRGTPTRVSITSSVPANQPQISAKIRPETVLANAYFDLGTWSGFTPYVGGGAGVARLVTENYTDTTITPTTPLWGKGKSHNFAWAAMAGVAFQVTPSWMIDVGYRYISFGDVASTDMTMSSAGSLTPYFKNVTAQEARVGFRFLLD